MNNTQTPLMMQLKELVTMLHKIKRTYASERLITIGQVQNKIWDAPELQHEEFYFLQELAGDLNFYEPVQKDRDATLGYYGDGRLLELVTATLNKIEPCLPPNNYSF